MSFAVEISSTDYTGGNTFQVDLPGNFDLNDYDVSVGSLYIYYSWFNISAAIGNNKYQLTIPIATPVTVTITIPDGAYNIDTLNSALQYWFLQNGYYIQNTTTLAYTYYAAFVLNPPAYSVNFITTALPSSSNNSNALAVPSLTGYTVGSAFNNQWPTAASKSMQLTVLSTGTFGSIIGFAAGTYPSSSTISGTTSTVASTLIPNVNPIYSVQCRLNCVFNKFSSNSQFLHSFTNGDAAIGQLIDASPKYYRARRCSGNMNTLILTLFDQNGNPLKFLDPNMQMVLDFLKTRNLDKY